MDEGSWKRWKHLATPGKRDHKARHSHLSSAERAALKAVIAGPYMLEQERIPTADAEDALLSAFADQKVQAAGA